MATVDSLRKQVREQLYSSFPQDRPFETLLTEALDTVETDVDVTDGNDWARGDVLEVTTTGEQCLVLSVTGNTLTVERAFGSVAATATVGAADRVAKNPRFTQDQIDTALQQVVDGFDAWGIHAFNTGTFTLAASQYYYELSETDISNNLGVLSVYYVNDTTKQPVPLPFRQYHNLDTTDADWSQGRGIVIMDKGDRGTTDPVYFTYAQSFKSPIATAAGLLDSAQEEIVVLGACARLLGGTIIPMTMDHGQRTDRSIPPGQTSRDVRFFQADYYIKVRAEAARLAVERMRLPRHRRTHRAGRWRW